MKALILAAGRGERLKELTKDRPKALVKIAGVSLLERVLESVREADVKEVYISLGYQGEKIIKEIGKTYRDIKINYLKAKNWEKGNLYSFLAAKETLKENFLLLMSDHLYDPRVLKKILKEKVKSSVILAVDKKRKPRKEDTKVLEEKGKILKIGKNLKGNCIDTGLFLCSPKIFSYAEKSAKENGKEMADCLAKVAQNKDAEVFNISKIDLYIPSLRREIKPFWMDIDTRDDIKKAKKLLIENSGKGRNDLLASYVNKPIENFLVSKLINTKITPNQVTLITNIIAYSATFFFFKGYLFFASVLTFIVSFMDGVDGKLSRVKLSFSSLGKMEHAFDFLFEHSWYIALALFLASKNEVIMPLLLSTLILWFDGFSYYCGEAFEKVTKVPLVDYSKVERAFRKFDGRKNSYIIFILVGVLLNTPLYSLMAITIWSFISALFYCLRAVWHLSRK